MPNLADSKKNTKECNVNGENASEEHTEDLKQHVSERVKLYEASMKESASPSRLKNNKNNNLRHVVPIGLLIVLFTLYLTTAAFQSNYMNRKQKSGRQEGATTVLKGQELQAIETTSKRKQILEKLLEYKDLCTELEVFTKDLRWINEIYDKGDLLNESPVEREQPAKETVETSSDGENGDGVAETESNAGVDSKQVLQNEQSRVAIKDSKVQNDSYKNNNSNNYIDSNNSVKKDSPIAKKSNTAEPIIYLFALVFIYLLLKAASDINQHYKSQNKGDKRLRRCSLQSYAQTHKQDRRASKGIAYNKP